MCLQSCLVVPREKRRWREFEEWQTWTFVRPGRFIPYEMLRMSESPPTADNAEPAPVEAQ
jgi:hypothetical protein